MAAILGARASFKSRTKRIRGGETVRFTLTVTDDASGFDTDDDVSIAQSLMAQSDATVQKGEATESANNPGVFTFDITFPSVPFEITYTVTVSHSGVAGLSEDLSVSIVVLSSTGMVFFTDALDGQLPDTDIFDRDIRTSVDGNSPVTITWDDAVSYDVVVLVLENATAWTVTPLGVTSKTGNLVAESLQYVYAEFDVSSGREIAVTATGGKIREVYVLKTYLDMSANKDRPLRYYEHTMDPGGRAFRAEDDTLIFYSGLAPGGKSVHYVGWDYLPKERLNSFRKLFLGPPVRKPFFIYADPAERPKVVHRVYWNSDFVPRPSASSVRSGYTLNMELHEI
ncbi:hypothetical protein F4Z99_10645 [Candidatus Poribacteria bacterium]|nr:hypothetical protein [Candidatus Poribacteria bacterium]